MVTRFDPERTEPRFTLEPGVRLAGIRYSSNPDNYTRVGERGVQEITVQDEAGQMAPVPWARILHDNGEVVLVNLAKVLTVVFADPFPPDESQDGGEE